MSDQNEFYVVSSGLQAHSVETVATSHYEALEYALMRWPYLLGEFIKVRNKLEMRSMWFDTRDALSTLGLMGSMQQITEKENDNASL